MTLLRNPALHAGALATSAAVLVFAHPFLSLLLVVMRTEFGAGALADATLLALSGFTTVDWYDPTRAGVLTRRGIGTASWALVLASLIAVAGSLRYTLGIAGIDLRRRWPFGLPGSALAAACAAILGLASVALTPVTREALAMWPAAAPAWLMSIGALGSTTLAAACVTALPVVPSWHLRQRAAVALVMGIALEATKYAAVLLSGHWLHDRMTEGYGPTHAAVFLVGVVYAAQLVMVTVLTGATRRLPTRWAMTGTCAIGIAILGIGTSRVSHLTDTQRTASTAEAVSEAPATHTFAGGPYRSSFSSLASPVLRVHSGDRVRTSTLDNFGFDAAGARQARPPNPQTGPFYIEGAEPGHTLAVTLDEVRLARDTGHSGSRITPTWLDAPYVHRAPPHPTFAIDWQLDRAAGTAMLAHPPRGLEAFRVPLRPMLGGIGVAPPGRADIPADHLGSWGGNLDYPLLVEGTTVYLPIFHPGALLFVGDGHAVQGDGEVTGSAVETALDLALTVRVMPSRIDAPRAESADFLMTMGIGASLPEAIRRATTNMMTWLEAEYAIDRTGAAMIAGTVLRYDIAELVDPQIHVVARVPKASLAAIPSQQAGHAAR